MNLTKHLVPVMNSTNKTTCNLTIDEYCDYDYDASDLVPVEELIPVAIVYGFTMIFGVIGNTLVIVSVARFKKMQNVTNMFLLSLASADLLLVLICVPVKVHYLLCCKMRCEYLFYKLAIYDFMQKWSLLYSGVVKKMCYTR